MRLACLAFVLIAAACGTSRVKVSSYPTGARILVDGEDTGRVTPDVISTRSRNPAGRSVSVELDGYADLPAKRTTIWTRGNNVKTLHFGFAAAPPQAGRVMAPSAAPPRERYRMPKSLRCAALPMKTAAVSEGMATVVDEMLLAELMGANFDTIGRDDVNAMLNMEKQRDAMNCASDACFAEIGQALGVSCLVSGNAVITKAGSTVTLKFINTSNASVASRVVKSSSDGEGAIPGLIAAAVQDAVINSGIAVRMDQ